MKTYEEETLLTNGPNMPGGNPPEVSVFLPVYNEEPNLRPLHLKLDTALKALGRSSEIIYVDDGSTDGSLNVLRELAREDDRVRVVALRRNYGQTAAMAAGIDAASGEVLIPMDADMQNDPADIARRTACQNGHPVHACGQLPLLALQRLHARPSFVP